LKYKKWMAPLVVIAVLLLVFALRWHMEAYIDYDKEGIVKFYRDRWTGNVWLKAYTLTKYVFSPVGEDAYKSQVRRRHDIATLVWMGLMVAALTWLYFALPKRKKPQEQKIPPPDPNFVLVEQEKKEIPKSTIKTIIHGLISFLVIAIILYLTRNY
jgi:hypothetical protein